MDIKEKLNKRVRELLKEGEILNQEQLNYYISNYFDGVAATGFADAEKARREVMEMCDGAFHQPFYFTFGSWEQFPFQNGYIILYAESIRQAARRFKELYPNPRDEEVLNCSDYYNQVQWNRILADGYYVDREPLKIIGKAGVFYVDESK